MLWIDDGALIHSSVRVSPAAADGEMAAISRPITLTVRPITSSAFTMLTPCCRFIVGSSVPLQRIVSAGSSGPAGGLGAAPAACVWRGSDAFRTGTESEYGIGYGVSFRRFWGRDVWPTRGLTGRRRPPHRGD